jgi:transcription initiation factor TFIID TATA-box-binding protein
LFDFEITVENVVMTGSFSESIDLYVAHQKLEGSKRNWKQLSGLSFRLKKPSATFLLFQNGKFICTNTKTKTKAKQALTKLLNLLKTEKIVSTDCTFECYVKNLVASVNLSSANISPEQFTTEFETIYDPDKCPADIHKPDKTQATFLCFLTGKMICSGVTDEESMKKTVKEFYDQLVEKNVIAKILNS